MISEFMEPTGWLHNDMGIWKNVELMTTQSVDDEIFSSLEYISEVDEVGVKFFKDIKHQSPKKSLLIFRAFIRQAKTFYYAAKQVHYRASALLYYYSFLNLAKAYVTVSDVNAVAGKISHGLAYKFIRGGLQNQGIFVTKQEGVFHKLYEKQTLVKIPVNLKLSIKTLLGYCTDVSYEYETAEFGSRRVIPVSVRLLLDDNRRVSWPLIAVAGFSILNPYKKTLRPFFDYFEQTIPNKEFVLRSFDIHGETFKFYTFFQSNRVYQWQANGILPIDDIKYDFHNAIKGMYDPKLHDQEFDFHLSSPLRTNLQIPMNQSLAIYLITFYLGSLVRYNPSYLESILNSKDAWLIERFAKCSPETFLRYIANAILQKNIIYKRR